MLNSSNFARTTEMYLQTMSLLGLLFLFPIFLQASVDSFLDTAIKQSENFSALELKIQSLQREIEARDIVLSSQLTLSAENFNNNLSAVTFARRSRTRFFDLTLDQPFSTGTLLSLNAGHDRSVIDNIGIRQIADWEARLTQSLWRDGFGQATSLRHHSEQQELKSRQAALIYEKQLLLIDLESLYWDYATLKQQEKIRTQNLQTSRELLQWTQNRLKKRAAEKADLLQVQALVSGRELDLIAVKNQLASLQVYIQSALPDLQIEKYVPDLKSLSQERSLLTIIGATAKDSLPMRWDSLSSEASAQQAEWEAKKVREQLKPKFDVYVSYAQNGIQDSFDRAWSQAGNNRYSGTRIGVFLNIPLDRDLTGKQEEASLLQAKARKLEAQAQQRSSRLTWLDLNRRQKVLQAQASEAEKLSLFQSQKVIEERRRFKIGRSTLFQLVSFEIEAAEAAIRKLIFLAELHKLESQARLFTTQRGLN